MNEITITQNRITAKDVETCKNQAEERLRQIEEARKALTIIADIVRNYTGPKNAALCTKINKNAELLELFPKYPNILRVSFETYHSGKDYSKLTFHSNNNFLDYSTLHIRDYWDNKNFIDLAYFENNLNSHFTYLNNAETEAKLLLSEAENNLQNFSEFFRKLESLKNEYKDILHLFYIHMFPNRGILPIY